MKKFLLKFISLLAIMLYMSFSWASAQNMSSEKQLLTFGFTADNNTELVSDVVGVIDQDDRTVSVTVPFTTDVTALVATFTSSEFSKVYFGLNPVIGTLAVSDVTPWNYTNTVMLTVEAENKSYEHYFVTVTGTEPSTENDMLTFEGIWTKDWTGPCDPNGVVTDTVQGTFGEEDVTFNVPFGTDLDALGVEFTLSEYATCDIESGTLQDFDSDNDGVPEAKTFTVTSQSGAEKEYSVLPVVGTASVQDNLLEFDVPNAVSEVVVDYNSNTIVCYVPWSAETVSPTWTISDYAHMFSDDDFEDEICSGQEFELDEDGVTELHFWIQAEDDSEVSEFVLTVTNAEASTENDLLSIEAVYTKVNLCGPTYTDTIMGTIVTSELVNTVTFDVPFGFADFGVTITDETFSNLASTSDPIGTLLKNSTNNTIVITAEDGTTIRTYDVVINHAPISNAKKLLTFGFNKSVNNSWGFIWEDSTYAGVIDQELKRVTVVVPYNTNLYQLKAYFTNSVYSCVSIAESNGSFTPQFSELNVNNFSNSLTYVVRAEDGTQERYEVIVIKEEPLTGNDLIGFQIELYDCFGTKYYVPGEYDGTDITISVKHDTDLEELLASFTISDGATVTPTAGLIDFTEPVDFVVTSQAGISKTYTVDVTVRPDNNNKRLFSYWFDADYNPSLDEDVIGVVDETEKTVRLTLPWGTPVDDLVASFVLSDGAVMLHSGILQVSGVNSNNFVTPIVYSVYAENCTFVEYFVDVDVPTELDGDICENALSLELPVVNLYGNTHGFGDDYDTSPCSSEFMTGNDVVYIVTIPYESYLTGSIVGAYGSVHVFDMCPDDENVSCIAFAGGPNGGSFSELVEAGAYYVVVSTFAPPQSLDYFLSLTYQGTGIDDNLLVNSVDVYPNPADGMFNVNIKNADNSDVTVEIINISGSVIYQKQLANVSIETLELNSNDFSNGVYYLRVSSQSDVIVKKIIFN